MQKILKVASVVVLLVLGFLSGCMTVESNPADLNTATPSVSDSPLTPQAGTNSELENSLAAQTSTIAELENSLVAQASTIDLQLI